MSVSHTSVQPAYYSKSVCCTACWEATNLLVQIKALSLTLHIGFIKIVAAHLIFILHEQLAVGHARSVLDVLEVLHPLKIHIHTSS